MANWTVRTTGEDIVEIAAPGVIYSLEARPTLMHVQAFKDKRLIETSSFQRNGNDFMIEATDNHNSRIQLNLRVRKDRITTDVSLDDETFRVESPSAEHGFILALSLKKRKYPNTPFIKRLAEELRDNKQFQDKVRRATAFGRITGGDIPNGAILGCVTVCFMCGVEVALACLMCFECLENPPDVIAPGGTVTEL